MIVLFQLWGRLATGRRLLVGASQGSFTGQADYQSAERRLKVGGSQDWLPHFRKMYKLQGPITNRPQINNLPYIRGR